MAVGRRGAHIVTILGMVDLHRSLRAVVFKDVLDGNIYQRPGLHVALVGRCELRDRIPDRPAVRD